ncbi:helix-turn-helix domain-containing protein [Haloarcula marina]|uniref:helix-turn-helix domain-containing protein n=1 Tax=Haloarcula marina TaxID=2961574 RepID=UPI0024E092D1|nr:helix-turn-helix domain-containing protein [Halomicroarcula marina]
MVEFQFESAFLHPLADVVTDVVLDELQCTETGCRAVVWVDHDAKSEIDEALAADDSLTRQSYTGAEAGGHWYVLNTTDPPLSSVGRALLTADGALLRASLADDHWTVRARFPDRSDVLSFRDALVADGFDVDVRAIDEEGDHDFGLTDPQREVLMLALERGYFTVPRDASLSDLATALGISSQAASERLRRGTQTLVSNTLAEPAQPRVRSRYR